MRDERITKWADVLVDHSLAAKAGQSLLLVGEPDAMPLIEAVYEKCLVKGIKIECMLTAASLTEILLRYGSDKQIAYTPPGRFHAVQTHDLYLIIGASKNSKMLSQVDPRKHSLAAAGYKPILDEILKRSAQKALRWALTQFPTPSSAQDAEMGTIEWEEFVFESCYLNDPSPISSWLTLQQKQETLIRFLETKKTLRFLTKGGTDLLVNIEGMNWINCHGTINFPDGEIYTGPNLKALDGGVNGIVRFSLPTIYKNVEVNDIELHFKNGGVVEAKASKNEAFLREMISQDQGARFVGEIALGTNYRIPKCVKNILFDEKIGGTFHLALGKGYPETNNTNQSALHWDIIFDLRQGGSVYADEDLICQDGRFMNELWP